MWAVDHLEAAVEAGVATREAATREAKASS
jgi:hypothetical protein